MSLPDHLWIGPFRVEVGMLTQDEALAQGLNGRWLPAKQRIEVASICVEQAQIDTLLHEALHAIWDVVDMPTENEEAIVSRLSPQLMLLFQRNPSLRDVLFKGE